MSRRVGLFGEWVKMAIWKMFGEEVRIACSRRPTMSCILQLRIKEWRGRLTVDLGQTARGEGGREANNVIVEKRRMKNLECLNVDELQKE